MMWFQKPNFQRDSLEACEEIDVAGDAARFMVFIESAMMSALDKVM
jgi:hypothetical protein